MLKLTNTLSGKKEDFIALNESAKKVGMYNCGPTVYDYAHIGNMRKYVFDDVLRRVLEFSGYTVNQVINITDVGHIVSDADVGEDKIEYAAKKQNKTAAEITHFFTESFFQDLRALNIEAAADSTEEEKFPRATHHIQEQIDVIEKLEKKGYTYTTSDAVYFDTSKFKDYGKLGNINIEQLKEGARVEANAEKRNPTDFALWKFSPHSESHQKRQQEWDSPWGIGFPGWHIECSAMSMKYLGETFDIHTGGIDHIPVHHNNEIAQSEAATGKKFVNYWLHEAFLNVDGGKMAKSLNNFYRLSDLEAEGISPLAYRYWLLTAHYRNPVNFTWEALSGAQTAYNKLLEHIQNFSEDSSEIPNEKYLGKFTDYINDDLDTPKALALVWELIKDASVKNEEKKATLLKFDEVLGLKLNQPARINNIKIPDDVRKLIEKRKEARKNKNYKESDILRDEIQKSGFDIKDTETGTEILPL